MIHPRQQFIKHIRREDPETLDEIAEAVIAVINARDTVVGFAWDIKYQTEVSNSHQAPIGGHQNWGGHNNAARGVRNYPGFYGRVWIRYAEDNNESFGAHGNFAKTLTYPGSGGAGSYDGPWTAISHSVFEREGPMHQGRSFPRVRCFSWDYKFFLTDFPKYEETFNSVLDQYNKEVEWDLLKDRNIHSTFALPHRFQWEDPDTKATDDAFLEAYKEKQKMNPKNNPKHSTV